MYYQLIIRYEFTDLMPVCVPYGNEVALSSASLLLDLQVELQPSIAIPCIVSFAAGQERRVYFSVAGAALSHLPVSGPVTDKSSKVNQWEQSIQNISLIKHY